MEGASKVDINKKAPTWGFFDILNHLRNLFQNIVFF